MQDNRTATSQTLQTINATKRLTISNACANHNKNQTTVKQFETFQILKHLEHIQHIVVGVQLIFFVSVVEPLASSLCSDVLATGINCMAKALVGIVRALIQPWRPEWTARSNTMLIEVSACGNTMPVVIFTSAASDRPIRLTLYCNSICFLRNKNCL